MSRYQLEAFVAREEYLYPTYSRDLTFFEKIAFWSKPTFESPSQPVGLRPADERRTYQDDEEVGDGSAGGR